MKVLVTGAGGQLGKTLLRGCPATIECVGLGKKELNLADSLAVERKILELRPDVVVNAGAYTAVDKAEQEPEAAFAVNARGVRAVAYACRDVGARLIHLSTDFVFDGEQGRPYRPFDVAKPLGVYGASKLEGEQEIAGTADLRWLIVRTAWVYSPYGRNFVLTMLRLFKERDAVNVVADQVGTPTSTSTLSAFLWRAVAAGDVTGIFHFTDAGVATWYDFAVAIREEASALGLIDREVDIVPITTDGFPTPARRPAFSVLDKTSTLERFDIRLTHWRAALRDVLLEWRK